jgi:hypothetical protein
VTLGKLMASTIPFRLRVACPLIPLAATVHAQQAIRTS